VKKEKQSRKQQVEIAARQEVKRRPRERIPAAFFACAEAFLPEVLFFAFS